MHLNRFLKLTERKGEMKNYYSGYEIEQGLMPKIDKGIFTKMLLQNLRAQKKLGYCKIGGRTYYTIEDIKKYIDKNKVKSA
jgi:hypothetical protein